MKNKSPLKKAAAFSSIAIQMGATIYIGVLLGKYFDSNYKFGEKGFTILFTLSFVALAMYRLVKKLNNWNKND